MVWFWNEWEKATDERVMKGAIAALDVSWTGKVEGSAVNNERSMLQDNRSIGAGTKDATISNPKYNAADASMPSFEKAKQQGNATAGEKRKRAAAAAESRLIGSYFSSKNDKKPRAKQKKDVEVIDLADSD